jgi:flagellar hook assembly protein FlgD
VANGTYYLKVDSVDAYGTTTSVTKPITVNRPLTTVTLKIYNSAGELVRTLYAETTAPSNQVMGMTLSTSVIRPGGNGLDGIPATVSIVLTDGTAVTWDGRGDNGAYVSDGTYYVTATLANAGGGSSTVTKTVSVLGSDGTAGNAVARPNVLTADAPTATLHVAGLTGDEAITAKIYTLAGNLVGTVAGALGQNDVTWNSGAVGSGMYFVVVETTKGGNVLNRTISKLLVRP